VFGLLLVLFVAVPAAELYVILQAAHSFGVIETVGALIVISVIGAWLCRVEGFSTLRKVQAALNDGRIPTRELQDGALILLAGALLLTPGFIGDVAGILLLLPPTRAIARTFLASVLRGRLQVATAGVGGRAFGWGSTEGPVVDVDGRDRDDGPPGPIPLGP
jgi:UPF0716 protein FxsA